MLDKNGNYKFFNMKDISKNLIEVFVDIFGEHNKYHIQKIINKTEVFPFHSFDYVNQKYLEKIKEYENEIIDEFCKLSGLKRTPEIEFILHTDQYGNNELKKEVYFGDKIINIINKTPRDYELFEDICVAFGISMNEDSRERLNEIYKLYISAVKSVELEHDCQLFQDINQYEKNLLNLTKELITCANSMEIVKDEDIEKIKDPNFDYFDLSTLDCYGKLFNFDFRTLGFIESFENKNPDTYDKICQLIYIFNNGATPKYIDKNTLENMYNNNYKNIALLQREYDYQKKHNSIYFVDKDDVKALKNFIKVNKGYTKVNCIFSRSYYEEELFDDTFDGDYYVSNYLKSDNILRPVYRMVLNCDNTISNKTFLSNIIHEFLHNLGYFNFTKLDKNLYFRQDGVYIGKYGVDNNGKIIKESRCKNTNLCEEFCNESIAKLVTEKYMEKFGVPELIEEGGFDWEYCLYDFYTPLYKDFFETFKDKILETKIHKKNLFYNKNYPEDVIEYLVCKACTFKDNLLGLSQDGLIDMNKFLEFNALEPKFTKILKNIRAKVNIKPEDLFNDEFLRNNLSEKDYKELQKILRQKDKYIASMIKDKNRTVEIKNKEINIEKER